MNERQGSVWGRKNQFVRTMVQAGIKRETIVVLCRFNLAKLLLLLLEHFIILPKNNLPILSFINQFTP